MMKAIPPTHRGLCLAAACLATLAAAHAHPGHDELSAAAPAEPAFFLAQAGPPRSRGNAAEKRESRVTITTEGDFRVIKSNGWPNHAPGAFPRRGNPNTAAPQDYTFRVPLHPQTAETPSRRGGWFFGVAVNGVPFEPGTGETWNNDPSSGWRYEAGTGFLDLGLDEHHAHVQPTGAYHYHAMPTGLVERLGSDGKKMLLIGWAADGFPMYTSYGFSDGKDASSALRKMKSSYRLKTGARPKAQGGPKGDYDGRFTQDFEFAQGSGDLDECNGRVGVTPEFPQGIYHYYVTEEFPFIARMWRGTPDESFGKNGGPPPGGGPRGRPGTGLPGGILRDGAAGEPVSGAPDAAAPRGGGPGGAMGGRRMPLPPVVVALDLNGDGTIDESELAAATTSLRTLDKNGDGKLTPDELSPFGLRGGGPPGERRGPPR